MDRDQITASLSLEGRTAIVTGGSRGIGRSISLGFAAMGANVVVASRKVDACDAVVAEITAAGGKALAVPTHMGDLDGVQQLVTRTVDAFGGVDIVVNNAANALSMPLGSITADAFSKSIEANVRGPLFLVQHALPHLSVSEHASVINMVSAGIFTHGQYMALYLAGKSALRSLTKTMAAEFATAGIRVNCIAPGTVATDMMFANPEEFQQMAVNTQLIRRMGEPDEIMQLALYLASDASAFVTGQTFVIDGGLTQD